MKKIDWKTIDIKPHHILVAVTSEPDYEMSRQILLQIDYDTYVLVEGGHCSCYDFDDTEWEAIEYTRDEIKKLANAIYNKGNEFWEQVKLHF